MDGDTDNGAVLDVAGVAKRFMRGNRPVDALRDVSFRAGEGRVTGLIGPDAAGKTTLMRIAVGLLKPDRGSVSILGKDVAEAQLEAQADVGYMPQGFGLYQDLTVQENMDLFADLQGVPREERTERYESLMRMTKLGAFTDRLAGRLSGGMKQKLGLACALVRSPRLLLLDEPTVGVDPVSRRELWSIVYRLVEDERVSVLLSTAYLDEAERCGDVLVLHNGELLGQGAPGEFIAEVEGRSFMVRSESLKKRSLQKKLSEAPGVIDAVVQADGVRALTDRRRRDWRPGLDDGVEARPVGPRFEDRFIDMIRERVAKGGVEKSLEPPTERGRALEGDGGAVISVKELKRRFGDFYAVDGVTFQVSAGEVFGLLGANGAGKTTTFRMLCGLLPPSEGQLEVAGHDLRHAAAAARYRIGYMSQKFSLYGQLSVRQNLKFFSSAYGLSGKRRRDRVRWALDGFELEDMADDVSRDLPLGFKQRLAMACALMHEPDILFLDEPTSGVDPLARREFWGRINELAEKRVTVMVTTHFMEEAEYCDRLAIMDAGKILAIGEPTEIRDSARSEEHPYPSMEDAFIRLIETKAEGSQAR